MDCRSGTPRCIAFTPCISLKLMYRSAMFKCAGQGFYRLAYLSFLTLLCVAVAYSSEPIVRSLLDRSVRRLHLLRTKLLYRSYTRLSHPPLNLQGE
jgi:hypothetical protein